jgi:hypothetical protein
MRIRQEKKLLVFIDILYLPMYIVMYKDIGQTKDTKEEVLWSRI